MTILCKILGHKRPKKAAWDSSVFCEIENHGKNELGRTLYKVIVPCLRCGERIEDSWFSIFETLNDANSLVAKVLHEEAVRFNNLSAKEIARGESGSAFLLKTCADRLKQISERYQL